MARNYKIVVGYESAVPCGNYELGAAPEPAAAEELGPDEMLRQILAMQREEQRRRKWTLIIGGLSALFAAGRLGILAVPFIKERRRRRQGG